MPVSEQPAIVSRRVLTKHLQIVPWVILTLLSGCSLPGKTVVQSPKVYLTKSLQWQLPGTGLLPPGDYILTQSVQADYGNKTADFLFHVEKQQSRLAMAALTPDGQPLVQLVYENGQVSGHINPLVPPELSLPYLVSDFLLAYGQEDQLRSVLNGYTMTLQQFGQHRIIRDQAGPVINIQYSKTSTLPFKWQWPAEVTLQNLALDYQLIIQTLSYTLL